MRTIRAIPILENIPVLVRAPLNEPVENGVVTDDYRLRRFLPTLSFLAARGARIVLISHTDPPEGQKATGAETLQPVAAALARLTRGVSFSPETTGPRVREAVRALPAGEILVLENLRRNAGEVKNDPAFARELAALADVFVQDSFDTAHRMHASIVGVPALLPAYAGLLFEEEVATLSAARAPAHPALAAIGGAKFSTKEGVLEALVHSYDQVFVGGALANDFLKISGREVGQSLISGADPARLRRLLAKRCLVLPVDSLVVERSALADPRARERARVAPFGEVRPDEIILDHGPATSALLADLAARAKSILWNGPFGDYERGFTDATDAFARAVAGASLPQAGSRGAHSVVGGGDTIAAIESLGVLPRFSFVSTGGGAMLELLAKGTLPGIEALG